MYKRRYCTVILVVLLICLIISCQTNKKEREFSEGIIEYEIEYFENENDNALIGLLPTTLELKFKNHLSLSKVVGWMGIFSSVYITNSKTGTNSTLLKFMNKKYSYECPFSESIPGHEYPGNIQIEFLQEEREILGYKCKKALITIPEYDFNPLTIFYTTEFELDNPFISNLYYSKIPGFLFEFPLVMNGIQMHLRIKNIIPCSVADEEFMIPDEFEKVSRKKMQEIIDSLI